MDSTSQCEKDSVVKDFIWTAYHGLLGQGKVLLQASRTDKIFLQLSSQDQSDKFPKCRIDDESVPILLYTKSEGNSPNCNHISLRDITMARVVKFINGIDPVYKIAEKSSISTSLLKQSLQTLMYASDIKNFISYKSHLV